MDQMASSSTDCHYPGESQYGRLYTDNNWQQVEYTFGSGEIATIFITTTPVASGAARTVMY